MREPFAASLGTGLGDPTVDPFGPVTALVLLWSRDEPERVGEVALVPGGHPGVAVLLGRAEASPEDPLPRAEWIRQRPGGATPTGPLRSARISRDQLRVEAAAADVLRVVNVGRCPLLHNGVLTTACEVQPGDLLELRQQVLLLCTNRPLSLPAFAPENMPPPPHPFGGADTHGIVGETAATWELRERIHSLVEGPDLNELRADIPLVARHLLQRIATSRREIAVRYFPDGDPAKEPRITPALLGALVQRRYTTHVQELEKLLWQAIAEGRGAWLDVWEGFPPAASDERLALPGVVRLPLTRRHDDRGSFMETWSPRASAAAGIPATFVQDNESVSERGVLRGLHLQRPAAQGKLVRVVVGEVYDVAVDLRPGSPGFGRWIGFTLTDTRPEAVWIPAGFAHGFLTLSARSIVSYKVDAPYVPRAERVLAWNDPTVGIQWPLGPGETPILSARDARGEGLEQFG